MAIGRNSNTVPMSATVARRRATDYLKCLAADVEPITAFDINEALAILNETREASEARRRIGVLDSETLNQKEDQQ